MGLLLVFDGTWAADVAQLGLEIREALRRPGTRWPTGPSEPGRRRHQGTDEARHAGERGTDDGVVRSRGLTRWTRPAGRGSAYGATGDAGHRVVRLSVGRAVCTAHRGALPVLRYADPLGGAGRSTAWRGRQGRWRGPGRASTACPANRPPATARTTGATGDRKLMRRGSTGTRDLQKPGIYRDPGSTETGDLQGVDA